MGERCPETGGLEAKHDESSSTGLETRLSRPRPQEAFAQTLLVPSPQAAEPRVGKRLRGHDHGNNDSVVTPDDFL